MMLSTLKRTVLLFGLFFCFILGFQAAHVAQAVDKSYGLNETMNQGTTSTGYLKDALSATDPRVRIGQIIGIVLSFIGVIFLILIIYAGISWMTAAGNDQHVTKAKDLMINAVIGLVIIFAAYAITAYIGDLLTNPSAL